jgi:hypothetical protein
VGDESNFLFCQKLLGEDRSVRQGIVMVKQPGLFSPKFRATSSHSFMQSPQTITAEPGIHSLACWYRCFALSQLLYRWRHQSRIFWIPPRIGLLIGIYHYNMWLINQIQFRFLKNYYQVCVNTSGRVVQGVGLVFFACWENGFKSHREDMNVCLL